MLDDNMSKVEDKFCEFYERWVGEVEDLLRQMVGRRRDGEEELIGKVTGHVKGYYTAKWAAAREDVVAFYRQRWLTPLEVSFTWLTGSKPTSLFRLLDSAAIALSDCQSASLRDLRARVRSDEERLDREMERHHVAVADRRVLGAGLAVAGMLEGLERVMKAADCVRLKALKGVLDRLTPPQCIDFLAALFMLQIHLRHCGRRSNGLALPISSSILLS